MTQNIKRASTFGVAVLLGSQKDQASDAEYLEPVTARKVEGPSFTLIEMKPGQQKYIEDELKGKSQTEWMGETFRAYYDDQGTILVDTDKSTANQKYVAAAIEKTMNIMKHEYGAFLAVGGTITGVMTTESCIVLFTDAAGKRATTAFNQFYEQQQQGEVGEKEPVATLPGGAREFLESMIADMVSGKGLEPCGTCPGCQADQATQHTPDHKADMQEALGKLLGRKVALKGDVVANEDSKTASTMVETSADLVAELAGKLDTDANSKAIHAKDLFTAEAIAFGVSSVTELKGEAKMEAMYRSILNYAALTAANHHKSACSLAVTLGGGYFKSTYDIFRHTVLKGAEVKHDLGKLAAELAEALPSVLMLDSKDLQK